MFKFSGRTGRTLVKTYVWIREPKVAIKILLFCYPGGQN